MNTCERDEALPKNEIGSRSLYSAIAAILIGAFLLQTLLSMSDMSATADEPIYIAAGYAYLKTRDGRINIEHPPLSKLLIAIPLLPLGLKVPTNDRSWQERDESTFVYAWMPNDLSTLERVLFLSRLPIVLMGMLLAVFVRKWAAELWGEEAGLVALLLFVFEPNILAHSRLATLDMPVTTFTFISMYYVWKWLRMGHAHHAVVASVMLGLALASKATVYAFLPIFLAEFVLDHYAVLRSGSTQQVTPVKGFVQLVAGGVVVIVVIYAVAFSWHPLLSRVSEHASDERPTLADHILAQMPGFKGGVPTQIVALGQRIWIPDLDTYISGLYHQGGNLVGGHSSYLMGHHSIRGWWYYFPVTFLIKTPLPILLLVIMRLFLLTSVPMVVEEYMIVLPIIIMMTLACLSKVDIGLRYLLPLYPFLFVWLSRIVTLEVFGRRGLAME